MCHKFKGTADQCQYRSFWREKNNKDPKLVSANTKAMAKIRGGKVF